MKQLLVLLLLSIGCWSQTSVPGWPSTGGGGSAGSGTGSSTAQPSFLVTASPYNAKCDGSTDDTTAIQAAITAAAGVARGGTVILPSGICIITVALAVPAGTTSLMMVGQGWQTSGIQQNTATADIIDVNGTGPSPANGVSFQNFLITRPGAFSGSPKGISFNHCNNCSMNWVQAFNSFTNFYTVSGANTHWNFVTSVGTGSTVNSGFFIDGATNSLFITDGLASGNHTTALKFNSSALDTWLYRFQTTSGVATGISIAAGASDIHIVSPVLDVCSSNCINVTGSTSGGLGADNNIQIVDCWCNSVIGSIAVSGSEGVHIVGGRIQTAGNAVHTVSFLSGSSRNSIVGASVATTSTATSGGPNGITIDGAGSNDNVVSGNILKGFAAHGFAQAIQVSTSAAHNTISGNAISGAATLGILIGSPGQVITGNTVDSTSITTAVNENTQGGGSVYSGTQLTGTIVGDAYSYLATSAITGPVPVKWDTGNANQVVQTVTTDTGGGIPVGVCVNSPGAGAGCLVMTTGTVALTLGTGTCSIGNFVIVDTTTNGRVKCTGTYTAGTVIGVAEAAQAVVGNTLNVQLGLR